MNQQPGPQIRAVSPIRSLVYRFAYLLLILSAFGLMLVGKADTVLVERMRSTAVDAVAPVLDMASRPVATVNALIDRVRAFSNIYEDNLRLEQENRRLLIWQEAARRLEVENSQLRALSNFRAVPPPRMISARVIADMGGTFVHSMLLTTGKKEGVDKGQAVIGDRGLIGRIAESGWRASRVLLITDINSRIPVKLERSGIRGILAGDNSDRPLLTRLPADTVVTPGDRLVTSGHGGAFPIGLPVGRVTSVSEAGIRVEPFSRRHLLEVVRVADYGLAGLLPDPLSGREQDAVPMPDAPLTPEQRREEALRKMRLPSPETTPPRLHSMNDQEAETAVARMINDLETEYGP